MTTTICWECMYMQLKRQWHEHNCKGKLWTLFDSNGISFEQGRVLDTQRIIGWVQEWGVDLEARNTCLSWIALSRIEPKKCDCVGVFPSVMPPDRQKRREPQASCKQWYWWRELRTLNIYTPEPTMQRKKRITRKTHTIQLEDKQHQGSMYTKRLHTEHKQP